MSEKDIAVQPAFRVPDGSTMPTKPCYLVVMNKGDNFIALELPAMEPSHIKTKGIVVKATEEHVIENYAELVKTLTADKKNIIEVYYPWHKISHVRSLVYNANKSK